MMSLRNAVVTSLLVLAGVAALPSMAKAASFALGDQAPRLSAQSETSSKKPRKAKAAKKSKSGGKVTFHDGSAESRSERDRRLKRECKGRSNSGVCEGYTR